MADRKTIKEKYMEYQMLEEQVKSMTGQLQELNNKVLELEYLKLSLGEFANIEEGQEILAPISQGIFVKAKVLDNKTLLVNVGSSVVVPKTMQSTKELLAKQQEEIEEMRGSALSQIQEMTNLARQIESDLKELTKDV
jgi:prefoldin alpha subunit